MFDVTADLAEQHQHQHQLAALPVPMSPTCVRSLLNAAARDHVYAETHRKAGQSQRTRAHQPRADRLTRTALQAEARAADLVAEVR